MSGIIRIKKDARYFVASNEPFQDKSLSWEAKGVLGYLLSKPDNWIVRTHDIIRQGPAGAHKVTRILNELKKAGYMRRERQRKPDGTFEWETVVYESRTIPQLSSSGLSSSGLSTDGLSKSGEPPHIEKTESAITDLQSTEGKSTEREALSPLALSAISIWSEVIDKNATKAQKQAIAHFVGIVDGFDTNLWHTSISTAVTGGCKPTNLEAIQNTYLYGDGDYGTWMELRRQAKDGGWDSVAEMLITGGQDRPWYTDEERRLITH